MGSRISFLPAVSLPVLYFPRPSEPCYAGEGTVLAGTIVFVHDDKLVNLHVFDKNGIGSGRIEVPILAEGGPRPDPGKEYCVISPFVTADTKLMQTICERLNMLQEIVGRQHRAMQKTDDPPATHREQLSAANTQTGSTIIGEKPEGEVVRGSGSTATEIAQELDVDYDPPADEAGEKAKEESSGDL